MSEVMCWLKARRRRRCLPTASPSGIRRTFTADIIFFRGTMTARNARATSSIQRRGKLLFRAAYIHTTNRVIRHRMHGLAVDATAAAGNFRYKLVTVLRFTLPKTSRARIK